VKVSPIYPDTKVILALVASAFVSFAYAQDVNFDSFKRIESDKVLNLSADQIAKIKKHIES